MSKGIETLQGELDLAEDEIYRVEMSDDMAYRNGSYDAAVRVRDQIRKELQEAMAAQEPRRQRITTRETINAIDQITHEWRVVAFRPNGDGTWDWYVNPIEARVVRDMSSAGELICTQRRDEDGTRLLVKLPGAKQ